MAEENQIENERALRLQESRKNSAADVGAKEGSKISTEEGNMMIAFALFCDLISQIPVAGFIIDGIAWFVIAMWVKSRGLKYPSLFMPSGIAGLIPFVPAYTAMVMFIIFYNKNPALKAVLG